MIVHLVSINTENEGHRLLDIPKAALKAEREYGLYCLGSKEKKQHFSPLKPQEMDSKEVD